MEITIRAGQASAQELQIGELLTLQEIKLTGGDVRVTVSPGGPLQAVHIGEVTATAILTEASLNRLLEQNPPPGTRDLEIATLSGRIRISGKVVKGIAIPFTMFAVPEIEGGARLRLNVQQVNALGALSLGNTLAQTIGNAINETLARKFDTTRLPIPLRLTGLTVEPGRIILSASASLDITPGALQPPSQTVTSLPPPE